MTEQDTRTTAAPAAPPQLRRGSVVGGYVALTILTLGDGSVLVLLAAHLHAQGVSQGAIGPVIACYSIASLVCRLVAGVLHRPALARFLMPGGCLLSAVSFVLIAHLTNPFYLGLAIALNGAGYAVASTGSLATTITSQQGKNAGVAMGWYTGFVGLGYAISAFVGGVAGDLLGIQRAMTALALIPIAAALAFIFAAGGRPSSGQVVDTPRRTLRDIAQGFSKASPLVWLAFFVAMFMNLISGAMQTFFPLHGLSLGLTLTQIGVIVGLHSSFSTVVRFVSPVFYRYVPYQKVISPSVVIAGASVATVALTGSFWAFALCWIMIGLCRGFLRVSSAALVMDGSRPPAGDADQGNGAQGVASGLYLAGLDLGKIMGPILAGVIVAGVGIGQMFLVVGLAFPLVFFVLRYLRLSHRTGLVST